jgi:PAS domain S-box-containing protein
MTIRSAVLLALLMSAGFLGNYYTVPLFFGADFLFGSIAVLLVLYFYGLGWGMLAALVAYSYTWVLWGHPYGCINFMSEALFVGFLLKWGRRNLVVLDSLFWLCLGMSMIWIEHGYILQMGSISTIFIMLKQSINGVFNALLVSLAIYYLPLGKLFQRPRFSTEFPLRDSLFSLLVMLVLLPALLLTMREIREEKDHLEAEVIEDLQSLSANVQLHLHPWFQQHVQAVQELAGLAGISSMVPTAQLQHETEILKQAFPNFRALHVENAVGRTIAFSPKVNEKGESTIGHDFSDRLWFKESKITKQPVVSELIHGRIGVFAPTIVIVSPIIRENRWLGTAAASLDLGMVQEMLKPYSLGKPMIITLSDSQRKIIASTAPDRAPMQFWDRKKTGVSLPLKNQMYHWYPDEQKLPSMTRWKQSFYMQEISLGPELPWKLTIEVPVAPLQQTLYTIYVKNLTIMAILTALALLSSLLLSRWLTRPLVQLSQVTANLPEKLSGAQNLDWPVSSALEINSLIANSKSMAHTLEENFHNLQVQADELRQVNQELNREIQERQKAEEKLGRSLSLQNATLESTHDGLLVVDRDGKISSYNKKFAQMWRIPEAVLASTRAEEVLTFVLQQLKAPEIFVAKVQKLYGEPEAESFDVIECQDGRIFERFSQPQRLGEEVVGRVWSFRDVTRQRRAEGALLEREAQYRLLAENVIDVIWTMDLKGKFTFASPSCESLSGYKDKEIVGMKLDQLLTPDSMDLSKKTLAELLSTENLARQEYPPFILPQLELQFKDGSRSVYIEVKGSFLKDSQGQPTGLLGVTRDITERKQLEEQFLQAQKMEAVGTLAGGIAHDFNNILTAILGNIGLAVLDAKTNPQVQDRLAQAEAACLRAQGLSQQLLTFAKGGAPVKKLFSVAELLTQSTAFTCVGSPVRCETTFPENLWSIEADPGQIGQVFQNLTINAIQAMPTGGTIKVWAENLTLGTESDLPLSAGRYIKISVRDQGMGIPTEHLPRIFEPYFTTKQKGSGLGLASAYAIIKKHHGHIAAESKSGVGTTFDIYLPAVEQQATPQPQEDRELLVGKGKILVMDDEEMVREVLGRMLAHLGYEAKFAGDAGETIEMFVQAQESGDIFAVVILDLTIPGGMGGQETMARLLEIDPQVKAIVSSGYSDDPIMADFSKYSFSGVIAKPYRISELSSVLNKVTSKVK